MTTSRKLKKKQLIEQTLFTSITTPVAKAYTRVPKGRIEPMRLLRNLPPFKASGAAKSNKKPKAIFLPYHYFESNFCDSDYFVATQLFHLGSSGFEIYYQLNNSVARLDYKYFKNKKVPSHVLTTEEIIKSINEISETAINKEDLLIFNQSFYIGSISLNDIVNYLRSIKVQNNPLKIHFITDQLDIHEFYKLLGKHKDKVESLQIFNCPNLQFNEYTNKTPPHLTQLKKLGFSASREVMPFVQYTDSTPRIITLPNLFSEQYQPHPDLQIEMILSDVTIRNRFYQINHITKLKINKCTLRNPNILSELFKEANNLTELSMLDFSDSFKSYTKWPESSCLPKLKILELEDCALTARELSHFLDGSELESLTLRNCKISNQTNEPINVANFGHLKSLTLIETKLNDKSINQWLHRASNLEKLVINHSTDRMTTNNFYYPVTLPKLKKLSLLYVNFSQYAISELLEQTSVLEELYLGKISFSPSSSLRIKFRGLKQFTISMCTGFKQAIDTIVSQNSSLETLSITKTYTGFNEASLGRISLPQLISLSIESESLTADELMALLVCTTKLEVLNISNFNIINNHFKQLQLPHLLSLSLDSITFDVDSYDNLIYSAPQLEQLFIDNCIIDLQTLGSSYAALKTFSIKHCRDARLFTNSALQHTPSLKYLHIENCLGYDKMNFSLYLPKLESIHIISTDMSACHVSTLLQSLDSVKRIILRSSQFATISFYTYMMQHVEELDLTLSVAMKRSTYVSSGSILDDTPLLRCYTDSSSSKRNHYTESRSYYRQNDQRQDIAPTTRKFSPAPKANINVEDVDDTIKESEVINKPLHTDTQKVKTESVAKYEPVTKSETASKTEPATKPKAIAEPEKVNKPEHKKNIQKPIAPKKPVSPKRDLQTLPDSSSALIDATHSKDEKINRSVKIHFIGKPYNPDTRLMRGTCYNSVELNPACINEKEVFLLNETLSADTFFSEKYLIPPRSAEKLYSRLAKEENAILGRYETTLTKQWKKLASFSASESIISYYLDKDIAVEFIKSNENHIHYIRLADENKLATCRVYLELLLSSPRPKFTFSDLPVEIRELAKFCRGFRDEPLRVDYCYSATDFYEQLKKQRRGTCRHRANIFALMLKEKFPQIPVSVISNGSSDFASTHMFAEITYQGEVITIDCGGTAANINYTQDMLPEQNNTLNERDALLNPEETFTLSYSPNGTPLKSQFTNKATNIATIEFDKMIGAVPDHILNSIDTLHFKSCELTAKQLHEILNKTKLLKTLSLIHCTINPAEFKALNFSMLTKVTFIKIVGSSVTNEDDLARLINTTTTETEWLVDTPNVNQFFHSRLTIINSTASKALPQPRYFKPSKVKSLTDIAKKRGKSTLIDSIDNHNIATMLQYQCRTQGTAWFYVGTGDDFITSAPGITKRADMTGAICQGPTGPFYQFVQSHQSGTIIVDYLNFKHADYVRFNSLFNETGRHVDGLAISAGFNVIGTTNLAAPNAYRGADFTSRFKKRINMQPIELPENTILHKDTLAPSSAVNIELAGGSDWEARLVGHWTIHGTKLTFTEGLFIKHLRAGCSVFNFNNCPEEGDEKEFDAFLRNLDIHQGVFLHGELIHKFSAPCSIYFSDQIDNHVIENNINYMNDLVSAKYTNLLNSETLSEFLGKYYKDINSPGIILKPGLIEKFKGSSLYAYMTKDLSNTDWLSLLDKLKLHHTKLILALAPGVNLPHHFNKGEPKGRLRLSASKNTLVSYNASGEAMHYPPGTIVIDVTELGEEDLLDSLNGTFNQATLSFEFTRVPGYLDNALSAGKSIYLKGKFSDELASALHPIIKERLVSDATKGELVLITDNPNQFDFVAHSSIPSPTKQSITKRSTSFDDRMDEVISAFKDSEFITIVGCSGSGKTYFMLENWKAKYGCFHGQDQLEAWINTKVDDGCFNVFLIDECDTVGRDYMEFNGLQQEPPGIFVNGTFHQLAESRATLKHRVAFIHNPHSYGGERRAPRLFSLPHIELEFQPFPLTRLLTDVEAPEVVKSAITRVLNYFEKVLNIPHLLTPREVLMMIEMCKVTHAQYPDNSLQEIARYFTYYLSAQHVPDDAKWDYYAILLRGCDFKLPLPPLPNTEICENNQIAYEALIHQLNLRDARLKNESKQHIGLGGIILEGEPGVGKSLLIIDALKVRGLKEGIDYIHIPVSLDFDKKISSLLHAFHEGMIVVTDEINSSPMLEFLLNALLSGYDLEFKRARKPGFILLGTQNPAGTGERLELTLPILHRLQVVVISSYTSSQLLKILVSKRIPHAVAKNMIGEYARAKIDNNTLCDRDLFKVADKWLHKVILSQIRLQPLFAIPQVGQMCKVVSIANVDAYFAEKYHYQAIPLRANHSFFTSQRRIAKQNGSRQGEILEFNKWRDQVTQLGYESEVVDFTDDNNLFLSSILSSLKNGDLPMIAYAVNTETRHPDPNPAMPQDREHAAVIIGYNPQKDEVTLLQYGHQYHVNFTDLFHSAQALSNTRKQEFYLRNALYNANNKAYTHKYLPAKFATGISSIVPKPNTGFRAKLLIVKKPGVGFKRNL